MISQSFHELRISRELKFSPERVFDAWLDPRIACRWLFTSPTSEEHTMDADTRVGGKWSITDRRGGVNYTALGEYLEIDRPRRLVFSFGMPQFSVEFARVTVEVVAASDGCTLTLTHEQLPWASVPETEKGWMAMLDGLADSLEITAASAAQAPVANQASGYGS
jgi:uncharacterized protein YndB with AHSA1/START domain